MHPGPASGAGRVTILVLTVCVSHTVVPFENVHPGGVGGPPLATADDAPSASTPTAAQHSSSLSSELLCCVYPLRTCAPGARPDRPGLARLSQPSWASAAAGSDKPVQERHHVVELAPSEPIARLAAAALARRLRGEQTRRPLTFISL